MTAALRELRCLSEECSGEDPWGRGFQHLEDGEQQILVLVFVCEELDELRCCVNVLQWVEFLKEDLSLKEDVLGGVVLQERLQVRKRGLGATHLRKTPGRCSVCHHRLCPGAGAF